MGLPFRGFYSASKAALDKITEAIRYEIYPWNIQVCSLHLGDIKTNIAENRIKTSVSEPYKNIFNKVYSIMNTHVDKGTETSEVALYINKLLKQKTWKAHYYFGKFGQKIALEEISFEVKKGEIFGFLGPSGSGKTTMIKILTGQLNADNGQTELLGKVSEKLTPADLEQIGLVSDTSGFYEKLSLYKNLQAYAKSEKHIDIINEYILPYTYGRSCIDYEA